MRTRSKSALAGLSIGVLCTLIPALQAACELGCGESTHWAYKTPSLKCVIWDDVQGDEGNVTTDLGTWTADEESTNDWDACPYGDCNQECTSVYNVPHISYGNGVNQGCTSSGSGLLYECLFP